MTTLSVIVPVLDEAESIRDALLPLSALRRRGVEVIVVDGGSQDGTLELAAPLADRVLVAARGRASRLRRLGRPLCLSERVVTSGRRWERHGVMRTVLLMWRLRLAYFFGARPAVLARWYGYVPRRR